MHDAMRLERTLWVGGLICLALGVHSRPKRLAESAESAESAPAGRTTGRAWQAERYEGLSQRPAGRRPRPPAMRI